MSGLEPSRIAGIGIADDRDRDRYARDRDRDDKDTDRGFIGGDRSDCISDRPIGGRSSG